jgi:hypothetical protein
MMTVEDHKILMRDRCIKCGYLRSFFPPPSMDLVDLSFGSLSLTTVCDYFLLMVFILLCHLSSISFLLFFLFFLVYFNLILVVIFFIRLSPFLLFSLYRLTIFLLPPHD